MKVAPIGYTKDDDIIFNVIEQRRVYLRGLFKFKTETLIIFRCYTTDIEEIELIYFALQHYNWYNNVQSDKKITKLFKKAIKEIQHDTPRYD